MYPILKLLETICFGLLVTMMLSYPDIVICKDSYWNHTPPPFKLFYIILVFIFIFAVKIADFFNSLLGSKKDITQSLLHRLMYWIINAIAALVFIVLTILLLWLGNFL